MIDNAKVQKPTRSDTVCAPDDSKSGLAIVSSNLHWLLPLLLSGVQVTVCVTVPSEKLADPVPCAITLKANV